MSDVLNIGEGFLLALALGVALFSNIASSTLTGGGFQKLISSVIAGLTLVVLIFHLSYASYKSPQAVMMFISFVCSVLVYAFHRDKKNILMWLLYSIQSLTLLGALFVFYNAAMNEFLFGLSSSIFAGIITYAMILGHWYLVVPKLSEKPLLIATYITTIILIIKITITGFGYFEQSAYFSPGSNLGAGYMFNWIVLLMRAGWGYIVIGVMNYFSWKLIRMRSIQSATGMLYAMTFFVLLAELASTFLFLKYGMFI